MQKAWDADGASLLIDLTGIFVGGSEEAKLIQQLAFSLLNAGLSVATNDPANNRGAFGATIGITGTLTNLASYAVNNAGKLGLSLIPGVNNFMTAASMGVDIYSGIKDYQDCMAQ